MMLTRVRIHPWGHPRVLQIRGLCRPRAEPGCEYPRPAHTGGEWDTTRWPSEVLLLGRPAPHRPTLMLPAPAPLPAQISAQGTADGPEMAEIPPASSSPCSIFIKAA